MAIGISWSRLHIFLVVTFFMLSVSKVMKNVSFTSRVVVKRCVPVITYQAAGVTTLYKRGRLNIYELKNAARNLNPDLLSRTTDKHYSDWIIFVQCRQTIPDK